MNYFKEELLKKYNEEKKLYAKLQARFDKLSMYEGERLDYSYNVKRNSTAYYIHHFDEPTCVRHYCNKAQISDVKNIQEFKYLSTALKIIEKNLTHIRNLIEIYQSPYPDEVAKSLGKAYKDQDQIKEYLFGVGNHDKWLRKQLSAKAQYLSHNPIIHPESLTQIAIDGTPTRSKSEVNIYNLLFVRGCKIIYEMPIFLVDNWYIVDFLVLLPNGKIIIIEHMGLTNNHNYMNHKMHIIEKFIQAGWIPNVNLIVTYEDINGNIDMQAIARQIDLFSA